MFMRKIIYCCKGTRNFKK